MKKLKEYLDEAKKSITKVVSYDFVPGSKADTEAAKNLLDLDILLKTRSKTKITLVGKKENIDKWIKDNLD